jgi:hemerythrin-like domain-containing protein
LQAAARHTAVVIVPLRSPSSGARRRALQIRRHEAAESVNLDLASFRAPLPLARWQSTLHRDLMDAIDLLERHHRELEQRFSDMKTASSVTAAQFSAAADLLATHITIEEQHFYPAVRAHRTEDILLESLEEHLSIKRVLADLVSLDAANETFGAKIHVLAEQLEHHHKEEEENLFPKVRKLLSDGEREALGQEMHARMRALQQEEPRKLVLDQTDAAAPLT